MIHHHGNIEGIKLVYHMFSVSVYSWSREIYSRFWLGISNTQEEFNSSNVQIDKEVIPYLDYTTFEKVNKMYMRVCASWRSGPVFVCYGKWRKIYSYIAFYILTLVNMWFLHITVVGDQEETNKVHMCRKCLASP